MAKDAIETNLKENRVFKPSREFSRKANVKSRAQREALSKNAARRPEKYWENVKLPTWLLESVSGVWNVATNYLPEMLTLIAFSVLVVWYGVFSILERNKVATRAIELVAAFPFPRAAVILISLSMLLGLISFLLLRLI